MVYPVRERIAVATGFLYPCGCRYHNGAYVPEEFFENLDPDAPGLQRCKWYGKPEMQNEAQSGMFKYRKRRRSMLESH